MNPKPYAGSPTSQEWLERLRRVMPFGSSTCSKAAQYAPDEPGVIVRGSGCRVWDADGREYIDFRNSLGPVTLGYRYPAVDEAIREQLEQGIAFGHPHPLECEVAERICHLVPCAEQARFLKTGGEAVAACIRIARAYTNRPHVIQIGYHGWLNSLGSEAAVLPGQRAAAVPRGVPATLSALHHVCGWNRILQVEGVLSQFPGGVAAVVVAADYETMEQGAHFLPALRTLTSAHGALLIFDEIVTGFRIAVAGAQEYFRVTPDLAVYAKGIANGMPLSVYCGKREVLRVCEEGATITSTLGGETLSLAAARATLSVIEREDVIGHLWRQGEAMWGGLNRLFVENGVPAIMGGFWPCTAMTFAPNSPPDLRERIYRAAFRNGISLGPINYVSYSHLDGDIAEALQRLETALKKL